MLEKDNRGFYLPKNRLEMEVGRRLVGVTHWERRETRKDRICLIKQMSLMGLMGRVDPGLERHMGQAGPKGIIGFLKAIGPINCPILILIAKIVIVVVARIGKIGKKIDLRCSEKQRRLRRERREVFKGWLPLSCHLIIGSDPIMLSRYPGIINRAQGETRPVSWRGNPDGMFN
ncbi:unnamed protein product [Lactuca saligna]|uniref:Uncharacterized protein n=1 Tax=Lactuca saligna TaxID=75948 RepID=A0AA35ZU05_LACSI|nr:unnamed protein product [Lactuca saligna]